MITLEIAGAQWGVEERMGPDGPQKVIHLVDPQSGIHIVAPFDALPAKNLAGALSGLVVAKTMPPSPPV